MTNKNIVSTRTITLGGETVEAYRVKLDVNGNPRYVLHFLSLGVKLEDYGKIKGLKVYRPKWFGGGIVLESCYNVQEDAQRAYNLVQHYYNPYAVTPNEKQLQAMERLANRIERKTNTGLASAYCSESYFGHDSYCMIVNSPEYQGKGGHVVYNTFEGKAQFIEDVKQ